MKVRLKKEVTTYMPILIRAVLLTSGPILELGAGVFSTPLLHWLCTESGRSLVTCEKDSEYYEFAKKFRSRTHKIQKINNWKEIDTKTRWSVVLVGQASDRDKTAILLKKSAGFIILHDSEYEQLYGYEKAYKHFKYIYHWKFCRPYTTIVSNFNTLRKIKLIKFS